MSLHTILSRLRPTTPTLPALPVVLPRRTPSPLDATYDDMGSYIVESDYTDTERKEAMDRAFALEVRRRDSLTSRVRSLMSGADDDTVTTWCPVCFPDATLAKAAAGAIPGITFDMTLRFEGFDSIQGQCAHACEPAAIARGIAALVVNEEATEAAELQNDEAKALAASMSIEVALPATSGQRWLIPGLLPADMLVILGATSGAGKTWIATHAGMCVATGKPWFRTPVTRARTLLLFLEGGRANLRVRTERLAAGLGTSLPELDGWLDVYPTDDFKADTPEHIAQLTRHIATLNYGAIIIDNLTSARSGGDENSSDVMGRALAPLAQIAQRKSVGILLLHHLNSRGELRGSSAIKQHADLTFEMSRSNSTNGSALTLTREKDRTGESPVKRRFRYLDQYDSDHTKIVSVVPTVINGVEDDEKVSEIPADLPHSEHFQELLDMLPATSSQIYNRLRINRNTVTKIRRQLERQGIIMQTQNADGTHEKRMWVRTDTLNT